MPLVIVLLSVTILVLVLLIAGTSWIIIRKTNGFWRKHGVQIVPNTGILWKILTKDMNPYKSDQQVYNYLRSRGNSFGGIQELGTPLLVITDPELMRQIFIKSFEHFTDFSSMDLKDTDPHMHHVLFNTCGQEWKNLRNTLTPAFTTGRIRRMFHIFESTSKKLIAAIEKEASRERSTIIDVRPLLKHATLDIISSAAFGAETSLFEDTQGVFTKMGLKWHKSLSGGNVLKFSLLNLAPRIAKALKLRITDEEADRFLSKMIIECMEHRIRTGRKRDDFIQLMLEARAGKLLMDDGAEEDSPTKNQSSYHKTKKVELTDDVIIGQALVFILGGFDTVEILLNSALFELALNPDVQTQLFKEIQTESERNGGLSHDVCNSLEYLNMVVSEVVRKYPPGARLQRICTIPYQIPNSTVTVPKGMMTIFPIYALHHDPEYWPEPERFDPDRFTKDKIVARHPMTYIPFGHGPRHCIGNRFALMETKVIIAHLLLKFKFEPCESTEIPLKFQRDAMPLRPKGSIWLNVTPREA